VFNELIGEYFSNKYNMDFRCLRYPGVISSAKYAFNGTTDYSTEIFFSLLEKNSYAVPLGPDQGLPMIYVDDCIDATVRFLKCDPNKLQRTVYNLAGISFTPKELVDAIQKLNLFPGSKVTYEPDFRSKIAASWPVSLDDSTSKRDWNWEYDVTIVDLAKKIYDGIEPQYKK
jgi:threonine 3-dehydrogenase